MIGFLQLDTAVFYAVNHLPHPVWADTLMRWLSGIGALGTVWFVIGVVLLLRNGKKDHAFAARIVSAAVASYLTSDMGLKHLVGRMRPTFLPETVFAGGRILTDYSFPSGHATMAFALAAVLSAREPEWRWILYLLAFLIAFSRVYLGFHYPSDVLGGAVIGSAIGYMAVALIPSAGKGPHS